MLIENPPDDIEQRKCVVNDLLNRVMYKGCKIPPSNWFDKTDTVERVIGKLTPHSWHFSGIEAPDSNGEWNIHIERFPGAHPSDFKHVNKTIAVCFAAQEAIILDEQRL